MDDLKYILEEVECFGILRSQPLVRFRSRDLETVQKRCCLNFPTLFGGAKFLGTFNAPKSLPNLLSLDQFCTICDPDVVDVWKNEPGSNYIFFSETLTWVWSHDSFSKILTVGDRFLINISEGLCGIEERKQKGVEIGIFFIFLAIFFRHCPIFLAIKHLYCCFWKFCSLELIKEVNRNSFIPLSTNSDAFRNPKKLVSKFDDFVCPQL